MNIDDFKKAKVYNRLSLLDHGLTLADKTGFFLEFGVYHGNTLKYMSKSHPTLQFYGFDSFEGLPEAWVRSENSVYNPGHFTLRYVPRINNNVKLIKGFFDSSLPIWIEENLHTNSFISFIHIDSDLYSSAKTVLTELNDYIKPGTIIVFDELCDWKESGVYQKWEEGEWRALTEWGRNYEVIGRGNNFEGAINVC